MKKLLFILFSLISITSFAQSINGPYGNFVPSGNYPSTWSQHTKGLERPVVDTFERNAIPPNFLQNGQFIYTLADSSMWRLDSTQSPIWVLQWQGIPGGNIGLTQVTKVNNTTPYKIKTFDSSFNVSNYSSKSNTTGDMVSFLKKYIVGFGDSITDETYLGVLGVKFGYCYELANFMGRSFIEKGIFGTTWTYRTPGDNSMQSRISGIPNRTDSCDYIMFNYSTNDCTKQIGLDSMRTAIDQVLDSTINHRLFLPSHILLNGGTYQNRSPQREVQPQYDSVIQLEATKWGCLFINNYKSMLANGAGFLVQPDSLHPNVVGMGYYLQNNIQALNQIGYSTKGYSTARGTMQAENIKLVQAPWLGANHSPLTIFDSTGQMSFSLIASSFGGGSLGLGVNALQSADLSQAIDNTGVGNGALFSCTTCTNNTAIGKFNMVFNTTGTFNTSVGAFAMQSRTGGTSNVAIGYQTMFSGLTNNNNVAVGNSALYHTTTDFNTVVGNGAASANTTGARLSVFGYNAYSGGNSAGWVSVFGGNGFAANNGGDSLSGFGYNVGLANTTGKHNSYFGIASFSGNTTGSNNSGFGEGTGLNNLDGGDNTIVGYRADFFANHGSGNVAIGSRAMISNASFTHSGNTAVGAKSMSLLQTGSNNTAIGTFTQSTLTTANGTIAIGDSSQTAHGNINNELSIGNLLYGFNLDGRLGTISSGNLVVGSQVDNLLDRFQVAGNISNRSSGTIDTAKFGALVVGTGNVPPSAAVAVNSTTRGFLVPVMTRANAIAISSKAEGLLIYDSTYHKFLYQKNGNLTPLIDSLSLASSSPKVVARADLAAQTSAGTVVTYTNGAADSSFEIVPYLVVTGAPVTDVIEMQVSYTDVGNTSRTVTLYSQGTTTATLATTGAFSYPPLSIRAKASTAITVSSVLTVGGGTITFSVGARIVEVP